MGRKRAYAPLEVFMNARHVGQFYRAPDGAYGFVYAPEWLAWANALPVSRALPLRAERFTGAPVIAVFDNLLPDNDDIRRRLAERVGAEGRDAYSLLARIGRDCVGALQFLPEGTTPEPSTGLTGEPLEAAQIAAMLRDLGRRRWGCNATAIFASRWPGHRRKPRCCIMTASGLRRPAAPRPPIS